MLLVSKTTYKCCAKKLIFFLQDHPHLPDNSSIQLTPIFLTKLGANKMYTYMGKALIIS